MSLVGFADEWFTFFPAGALEGLRADVGLTYAQGGAVLVALSAGGLIGFFLEIAVDYVSRRWLSALGALAYGAAMVAFGLADSLWMLVGAAFVWGAASDAFTHAGDVALVELAGDDVTRALARANAWAAVGDLLAPATLGLALALGWGWRPVFVGGGVLMLGYAAWLAAQRFPPPEPPEGAENPFDGVWAVLRDARVWLLAVLMGLFALLDEPLLGFTIAYLEAGRGVSPPMATALATGAVSGGVVGYLIAERVWRERSLAWSLAASAGGMCLALPAMVFAPWLWLVLAGGAAFGLAGAVFYTRLQTAVMVLRPGQTGSTGAVVSAIGLAGMGFPALAGAAADAWGLAAGVGLYLAVPAAILVLIAAFGRGLRGA